VDDEAPLALHLIAALSQLVAVPFLLLGQPSFWLAQHLRHLVVPSPLVRSAAFHAARILGACLLVALPAAELVALVLLTDHYLVWARGERAVVLVAVAFGSAFALAFGHAVARARLGEQGALHSLQHLARGCVEALADVLALACGVCTAARVLRLPALLRLGVKLQGLADAARLEIGWQLVLTVADWLTMPAALFTLCFPLRARSGWAEARALEREGRAAAARLCLFEQCMLGLSEALLAAIVLLLTIPCPHRLLALWRTLREHTFDPSRLRDALVATARAQLLDIPAILVNPRHSRRSPASG